MLADQKPLPPPKTRTIFKNPLLYSSLLVGIALLVVGWILFSRWRENLSIERRTREERSQKQLENDRVANAKSVKLEPQPNAVWPSYARCVSVSPAKSTTYTLTVSDSSGNTKTQSLQVTVE